MYVHVPFCEKICHYCDFNKYLLRDGGVDEYWRRWSGKSRCMPRGTRTSGAAGVIDDIEFDTVFIGGGTPTALTAPQLERLLGAITEGLRIASDAEITVEANPGTLTDKKLAALQRGGVNRLSLGVQSVNDELLAPWGAFTLPAVHVTVTIGRAQWFDNVSLDLIYGLPGQDEDDWRRTLSEIVTLAAGPLVVLQSYH